MLGEFNQPILNLRKFSSPSVFNPHEGLLELLLVNGIDDSKQEISRRNFWLPPSNRAICYNLLVSFNLLTDDFEVNSGQAETLSEKISRRRKYLFFPLKISLINAIEQFLSLGRKI